MLKRPPTHRVDATPVLILHEDDAWDHARIDREIAEAEAENQRRKDAAEKDGAEPDLLDIDGHPYRQYRMGETRFDLDAPVTWRGTVACARDYLDEDKRPVMFVLRRLAWDGYYDTIGIAGSLRRQAEGCRLTLARVDGMRELEVDANAAERSHQEMQRLFEFDAMLPLKIGAAGLRASEPLRVEEKKA